METVNLVLNELLLFGGIVAIFVTGYFIIQFLRKKNILGFETLIIKFCTLFSSRLVKKMETKDKEVNELNKEMHDTLKETILPEDKKEEKKDK